MPCRSLPPALTQNCGIVRVTDGQGGPDIPSYPPGVVCDAISWAKIDRHVCEGPSRDISSSKPWWQLHAETGKRQAIRRLSDWAVVRYKISIAAQAIAVTVENRTVLRCRGIFGPVPVLLLVSAKLGGSYCPS